jgi:hypothetical protein
VERGRRHARASSVYVARAAIGPRPHVAGGSRGGVVASGIREVSGLVSRGEGSNLEASHVG